MSRHRNIRTLKYDDEDDGYDDVYGHSVEEDYGVSPATANQFMFDRSHADRSLSSFVTEGDIPEEDEEFAAETGEESMDAKSDSFSYQKPKLSDINQAKLNSCLEQMRSVLGDSTAEHVLVAAALNVDFDPERAINFVLNTNAELPKPQRQVKERPKRVVTSAIVKNETNSESAAVPIIDLSNANKINSGTTVVVRSDLQKMKSDSQFSKFNDLSQIKSESWSNVLLISDSSKTMDLSVAQSNAKYTSLDGSVLLKEQETKETRFSTPKKDTAIISESHALQLDGGAVNIPKSASKARLLEQLDVKKEYAKRKAEKGKERINLVVVGHVDAGKSTLMGHLLYQLGFVSKKTMHKYENESRKLGKASFAYAWVLDETEEERSRGVTMDVAQTQFETTSKLVTLLDAPGHKDFIPNMITGAAQADVAILVVNSTRGEFESGFNAGGQTREHAMLIRSLVACGLKVLKWTPNNEPQDYNKFQHILLAIGVTQLCVAVNKMDTVDWSQERFNEIVNKLTLFLRQTGFKPNLISFVPCSGLSGENLTKSVADAPLSAWYTGPTLVDQIDSFEPPTRPIEKPLRMCITDVYKGMGVGFSVSGTIQQGALQVGDKVVIMPQTEPATIKGITLDEVAMQCAFAGDNVVLTIASADMNNVGVGSILSDPIEIIKVASRFEAQIVIFSFDLPITSGFPVVFHYQSLTLPAVLKKLISQLHRNTGEVIKKKPRCLTKNMSAVVEVELATPICLELYRECRDLGRFMLRYAGATIAAGLVTEIFAEKTAKST